MFNVSIKTNGFLLIEVLFSLAILASAVLVLMSVLSKARLMDRLSRDWVDVGYRLEAKVWEKENGQDEPDQQHSGIRPLQWSYQQTPIEHKDLSQWDVDCSWRVRSRAENMTLSTFVTGEENNQGDLP